MTLPYDLECELQAIATVFKSNEEYIDEKAYQIVGRQIEGATARLAELCGKSVDWIESRAKAYKLSLDLDEEFGRTSEAVRNLIPDSYLVAVARKYDPKGAEPDKLDLGEAFEKLSTFTQTQPDGRKWNLEAVRASLPHNGKETDYPKLIEWLEKRIHLYIKPVLLGVNKRQQPIAMKIADKMRELGTLISEYREAAE